MTSHTKKRLLTETKGFIALSNKITRFGSFLVLLVGLFFGLSLIHNIQTILAANKRIDSAYHKLEDLKGENKKLSEEVKAVENEHFVEKQARDKLGLARQGEVVIVLPEESALRRLVPFQDSHDKTSLPDPIWKKWWKLFF